MTSQYKHGLGINNITYDPDRTSSTGDDHGIAVLDFTDIHQTL
jgi:hypothetical protein